MSLFDDDLARCSTRVRLDDGVHGCQLDANHDDACVPTVEPIEPLRTVEGVVQGPIDISRSPSTRVEDPETSREAARSVVDLTPKRVAILRVLDRIGASTHEEIIVGYRALRTRYGDQLYPRQSESGIRSRTRELVQRGDVIDTGERRKLSTGRRGTVWSRRREER